MQKTILIIDDSIFVRQVLAIALQEAGYKVIEAVDGRDGLGKLDGQTIHLIISDLNMPNMDGIAFVEAAKKRVEYRFTPIIILSGESSESQNLEERTIGAEAWIVKPFRPAQMLTEVSRLILS